MDAERMAQTLWGVLRPEGGGKTLRQLKKMKIGTEREIMDGLLWMLDKGEAERNGKGWLLLRDTVILGDTEFLVVRKRDGHKGYPTLQAAFEAEGYTQFEDRIIKRTPRNRAV